MIYLVWFTVINLGNKMMDLNDKDIKSLFSKNKKCIVNADLDGVLSGMLLQKFLNWEVVGYSSCCGKYNDEIWLRRNITNIDDCVFVDLPVCVPRIAVIDQHFVGADKESLEKLNSMGNKINPNNIRGRVYRNENGGCDYTKKYPFGTVHFILAILEHFNFISSDFVFDFTKKLGTFDLADLVLRADRVIGNTFSYTPNCIDWSNWIIKLGGKQTLKLFNIVKNEYIQRKNNEKFVEDKLKSFGCSGLDGDCSDLFRSREYEKINIYFSYLGNALGIEKLPVFVVDDFGHLSGRKIEIYSNSINFIKDECRRDNVFSFAYIMMRTLSITYKED